MTVLVYWPLGLHQWRYITDWPKGTTETKIILMKH